MRVADLLARMTLAEKVAQLGSAWSFELLGKGRLDPVRAKEILGEGIGHVSRIAGASNADVTAAAALGNELQRFLVEETRLGIPAILHEETLHGLLARGATVFQQSIGAASSFDPDVVGAMAETLRRRMLLMGARHALAPVLDTARDPRWGRIEETYGEDPYLATVMGLAYVRAIQGPSLETGIVATAKHMVGHGLAEGGMNQAPVHAGRRELLDEQLAPFEAAVREGRIGSIMPAYCDVDGVPCHASGYLLDDILRRQWEFDGIVASDYMAVEMLSTAHRLTGDLGVAAGLAIRAGVDAELPSTAAYGAPLLAAIADGRVAEAEVDAIVERVLRLKLRLGLFERPYVDAPSPEAIAGLLADEALAARELAERSIVLAHNEGLLPLPEDPGRIAVVGPIADSARDLIGDYGHVLHLETLNESLVRTDTFGFPLTDRLEIPSLEGAPTILTGLRTRFGADRVVHERGTGLRDGTDEELEAAVAAAAGADVAIVVLGERSGLTDDSTTGEFRDRSTLGFLGRQQELLERVVATGTPVVLVVVSGRPLELAWASEHVGAILLAWVPGDAGPEARGRRARGRRRARRQAPGVVPALGGAGPAHLPASPDRRALEPQGPVRGLADDAAVAVRARAVVHDVHAREPRRRPVARPDGRRRGRGERRGHQHRDAAGRRGRPALRARPRGVGRPARARAPRVPPRDPRARGVPPGPVPAGRRAAGVHRRRLPSGRGARRCGDPGRHLLRRPGARHDHHAHGPGRGGPGAAPVRDALVGGVARAPRSRARRPRPRPRPPWPASASAPTPGPRSVRRPRVRPSCRPLVGSFQPSGTTCLGSR